MRFALNSLIENSQNNFRLFIDKELIEFEAKLEDNLNQAKENNMNREKLINLLIFILNHSFDEQKSVSNRHDDRACAFHFNIHKLSSGM